MNKEVEDMLKEPMTLMQKKMAVHYAVLFLRGEVKELEDTLGNGHSLPPIEIQLKRRLKELKTDLITFEKINDYFN